MKEEYQMEIIKMILQIEDLFYLKDIYAHTQRILLSESDTH